MSKSLTRLLLVAAVLFSSTAAQAETCDMLFGKFRIPKEPSGRGIIELAHSTLDPEYQPGQPAIELYREGATTWRRGLISGSRSEMRIRTDSWIPGVKCEAKLGSDVSIVTFDYSLLPPELAGELMDWLEQTWGKRPSAQQLQGVRYFLVQDHSMIGVANMALMAPLERYEKE